MNITSIGGGVVRPRSPIVRPFLDRFRTEISIKQCKGSAANVEAF